MFPAQALAEEMLRRGWRVALTTDRRGERYAGGFAKTVERVVLQAATPSRGGWAARMLAPFVILGGIAQAWRQFRADRPDCVAGFGGYPSIPALAAAWSLGLPRMIHEQNGVLGRVNRVFATRVDTLACGVWPVRNAPTGARLVHVGNPVRAAALVAAETRYSPPDDSHPINLLVFGGSQGASVLSNLVPEALELLPPGLSRRLQVTQQVRAGEEGSVEERYQRAGIEADLRPFFEDLPERIAGAQLVISRAGASTIAELAVIGRPSILVPFPAALDDHQSANATMLVEAGAAILAREAETDAAKLAGILGDLLSDGARCTRMAAAARQVARPDATAVLADLVAALGKPQAA